MFGKYYIKVMLHMMVIAGTYWLHTDAQFSLGTSLIARHIGKAKKKLLHV